ncbi:protein of unknown function [Rhizobium sp. NFR07]|uniref:DUF1963 domain-containing protein n=1 Tax=Rhizobium sp. NFR07 TaxID=1566262 RepID=UPI0008F09B9C|nr:DUF1963 domain-containing protein [Rhizobium sp. NFR07]SFB45121.1 protein of unknown function [Rhizobium sp. NFR07]
MAHRSIRWMTRDFVFTAPPGFPDVVASDLQRFELFAYPGGSDVPSLLVAVIEKGEDFDLDDGFSEVAAELFGAAGKAPWSPSPRQVFGREARHGTTGDDLGLTLVRGRQGRIWAFGWRSGTDGRQVVESNYDLMMQGLQFRSDETSDTILKSQFHRQQKTREMMVAALEAAGQGGAIDPDAADAAWDRRFAEALGETDPAAVAALFSASVSLVEEPFGEEAPLGASRIGGGPDLPPGTWPGNERGMHHPFLMQIDLAEIASEGGSSGPLPADGLLSFFVHGDALDVDVVYTPAGVPLTRHPMSDAIIEASEAAIYLLQDIDDDTPPGRLPHEEGDLVMAELTPEGALKFAHTTDPAWAKGEPDEAFEALSDHRWASAVSVRLRPQPSRSFDNAAAEAHIGETGKGSEDDLVEVYEAFDGAVAGPTAGAGTPQVHQMLGFATIRGGHDCRSEAARFAEREGAEGLDDHKAWIVLVRLRAGSATGMVFWDADDLIIMAPAADVAAGRFDRCMMLSG